MERTMDEGITYRQVGARLEEHGIPHAVLGLQNGVSIVISQRGGRVFGPFLSPDERGVFWVSRAFASPDAFRDLLASGAWNLGGERVWIAPEIQYSVHDRRDFWGTIRLPPQMDPGEHILDQPQPDTWRLRQDLTLEAYNVAQGCQELRLERLIRCVDDPLRYLAGYRELVDGVTYAGYEQVITLSEGRPSAIMSEAWNLVQLNPGGEILIPTAPGVEITDYFEPIDDSLRAVHPHHVRLRLTGIRRYKVGLKAAHVYGRLGYYHALDGGQAYLIVRSYHNDPSSVYAEEPADRPGTRGDSVHIYNDDGGLGGFGELECHGRTIGGKTGRPASSDSMALWLYVGDAAQVRRIALNLLGIEI